MMKYLKELTELKGVSGFEDDVREYIKEKIKDKVDELFVDRMGNLIALKKGNGKGKKILLVVIGFGKRVAGKSKCGNGSLFFYK